MINTIKFPSLLLNGLLFVWFTISMIGVKFGEKVLVAKSMSDKGIYWIIFVVALVLFIFKEDIGKKILTIWLGVWLIAELGTHELHMIIGGESQIAEYSDTVKIFSSTTTYIPDTYHIILHILLIGALIASARFWKKS